MEKFYITSSIAYTNSSPHVGFLLELLQADVIARLSRLVNKKTFFLTGTDEHGRKNVEAAERAGKNTKNFVDEIAARFQLLADVFNISNDNFIRTSDRKRHWPAVSKIWKKLAEAGDLYRKNYKGLYCVGHEAFMKPSELKDGECVLHKQKPEVVEEENWFFRLTKYKEQIKKVIESGEIKILPAYKKNETLNMLKELEDISFSRPSKDINWGVPVPDDNSSIIYIWVEALVNYLSGLGYGTEESKFEEFWPADIHFVGKDILKFHAVFWPAMLLSAGLALPRAIYVHGFITVDGEKMSKTVGNVIDPFALVEKYGVEPVRYFLLREIPSGEDGDFSYKKLEERYQADLANGLGNLIQRVLTLIENNLSGELNYRKNLESKDVVDFVSGVKEKYKQAIDDFRLHEALAQTFEIVGFANGYINQHKPWEIAVPMPKLNRSLTTAPLAESQTGPLTISGSDVLNESISASGRPDHFLEVMTNLAFIILNVGVLLYPFMPETSEKILESFGFSLKDGLENLDHQKLRIKKGEVLFPRL